MNKEKEKEIEAEQAPNNGWTNSMRTSLQFFRLMLFNVWKKIWTVMDNLLDKVNLVAKTIYFIKIVSGKHKIMTDIWVSLIDGLKTYSKKTNIDV